MTLTRQCPTPGTHQKPGDAMDPMGFEKEEASRGWQAGVLSRSNFLMLSTYYERGAA